MKNLLGGLFGKTPEPAAPAAAATPDFDKNPVAVAALMDLPDGPEGRAAAFREMGLAAEYARFEREFCVRPGVTLMQAIASDPRAADLEPLKRWLHPTSSEAEPKAIIRLSLAMLDRGLNIWEQSGIDVFLHGRWSEGGGCTDESYDALGMLVYLTHKPIKFFFKVSEDAEGYRVVDFSPGA